MASTRRLRRTFLALVYVFGFVGILASGHGGGDGDDDDETIQVAVPAVVADLADLSIFGSLDQPFDADVQDYTATVQYNFRFVQVTPVTADPNATVSVNGENVISGFASSPIEHFTGVNAPIEIVVTSADRQYSKTYRLAVTVLPASDDADLAALALSAGALNPAFDADTTGYTAGVDFQTTAVQVTATTSQAGATIAINGLAVNSGQASNPVPLNVGNNVVTITVTAQDQVNTKTYTVTISRAAGSDNADLSGLSISAGALSPAFQSDILGYSAAVVFQTSEIQVTATTSHANATVRINGQVVISGQPSNPIPLGVGDNNITIVVIAENQVATKTYTTTINRAAGDPNADLSGLTISVGTLDPAFMSGVLSYFASVDFQTSEVQVTATTSHVNATIRINGLIVASGQPSSLIPLNPGDNSIVVRVTAENLVSTKTYTVNVNRAAPDDNANLSMLTISAGTLTPVFQTQVFDYTASVGFADASVQVIATAESALATITVKEIPVDSGAASQPVPLGEGSNLVVVSVQAQSGRVQKYSVLIERQSTSAFLQQAYLKASNTGEFDQFGFSVALFGDTLAIGANQEGAAGAVYVFVRNGAGSWSQQAYLKASNAESGDRFGNSVALSGDTLAVGAPAEDSSATGIDGNQADNSADSSGAVYVFVRDGTGSWSQQAYIKASNTGALDYFGFSVALSGETLAVSAIYEASNATGIYGDQLDNSAGFAGAVYAFTRDGAGLWSQQAYIKASNTGANNFFGHSVALSGDTLAVGAWGENSIATGVNGNQLDSSASLSGAAYVFTRDGTGFWSQQGYIKASNTEAGDRFGFSVALSGDTLAVGAILEDSNTTGIHGDQVNNLAQYSGAVYVFTRDGGGSWSQQAYIKASNTGANDQFGDGIALSGDTLAVGAYGPVSFGIGVGGEASYATGVNGDQANNQAQGAGAVYVFTRDGGGSWLQQAYIKASNTGAKDRFGKSVSLSGDTLAIGAYVESSNATGTDGNQADNSAFFSGAAYVFR